MERDNPKFTMGGTYRQPVAEKLAKMLGRQPEQIERATALDVWPVKLADVSAWQGFIQFLTMRQFCQSVYIRAGYGNDGLDSYTQNNVTGASDANMPWGLYWYVKVGKDFKKHVASFYAVWKDLGGKLPPVWDCEYTEYLTNIRNSTTNWLTKLVGAWEDLSGVAPMIYTRASWWDAYTYRTDWPKYLDLWAAQYNSFIGNPTLPADWGAVANPRTWTIWQWIVANLGAEYGVSSPKIDLNRFNGTIDQFNRKYGTNIKPLGATEPPAEPPTEPPAEPPTEDGWINPIYRVQVTVGALNMRSGPTPKSADLGELVKPSVVPIVAERGDWLEVHGYIHKKYTQKL